MNYRGKGFILKKIEIKIVKVSNKGGITLRFARGLMIALLGFIVWVIASILGAFDCIGNYGLQTECGINNISPIFSIPLILGFVVMFAGPIYYWIVEPIVWPHKAKKHYQQPFQPNYNQPVYQQPQVNLSNQFCRNCGKNLPAGNNQFCPSCGKSLS